MIVGQYRTVAIDDESRAEAALALRPARLRPAEKTFPEIVELIVFSAKWATKLLAASAAFAAQWSEFIEPDSVSREALCV